METVLKASKGDSIIVMYLQNMMENGNNISLSLFMLATILSTMDWHID